MIVHTGTDCPQSGDWLSPDCAEYALVRKGDKMPASRNGKSVTWMLVVAKF